MRCFIACFLAPDSAAALVAARPVVDGCRPVRPENLHLTLHFLGAVAPERKGEVLALAAGLDGKATMATVTEVTGFPRRQRARVVVARLKADPVLAEWSGSLTEGWPTGESAGSFDPHVTLARSRIRRGVPVPEVPSLEGLELELLPPAAYRSETLREGVRYTPLEA